MHNQASDKSPLKNCIYGEQISFRLIPNKYINHVNKYQPPQFLSRFDYD
jgi:hypothetical protein